MVEAASLALHTDLYQLTMAAGYFHRGLAHARATCSMFVRRLPKTRRYLVAMGLGPLLEYLARLRFSREQIEYLRSVPALRDAMTPEFTRYLEAFRFTGEVAAMPEGTVAFANEPIVRVTAPIIEAQLIETTMLSLVNHATMIASKAARIVTAAGGAGCVEFGSRRTHPGAAVDAARASCATGFVGTSNVEAGMRFGLPVMGTAAHMWTMAHATEEEAFEAYVSVFPNAATLLVDTYDTLRGATRAAHIAKDKLKGVRLDSGDLAELSREVRAILDREGCGQAKIVASGDLNEHSIKRLCEVKAPIDLYGVGTELVASLDAPALSGVYKLTSLEIDGIARPIAKFSASKASYPGVHQVYRRFAGGVIAGDTVALEHEPPPRGGEPLLAVVMRGGELTAPADSIDAIRTRVRSGLAALPPSLLELGAPGCGPASEAGAPDVRPSAALEALVAEVRARAVGVEA